MTSTIVVKINSDKIGFAKTPKEAKDSTIKRVGASIKRGTKDTVRGLSPEQEEYFLPKILGLKPSSPGWDKAVLEYWCEYYVSPTIPGIKLNVLLEEKKAKIKMQSGEVKDVDVPVNLEDYIAYNWCLQSSSVAKSQQDMDFIDRFDFIMIDESVQKTKEIVLFEKKQKAQKLLLFLWEEIIVRPEKLDHICYLCKNVDEYLDNLEVVDKRMYLTRLADTNPDKLIEVCETKDLETKALVHTAVEYGVIKKEGNKYFFGDEIIGEAFNSAAAYLGSKNNTQALLVIKERVNEARKAKNIKTTI